MTTPSPEQPAAQADPSGETPSIWQHEQVAAPGQYSTPNPSQVGAAGTGTSANALVAFILAIASWIIPVIFAIVALVFARKADREIAASQGRLGGEAFVTAAKILAWINLGVSLAIFVLLLFAVLFLTLAGVASN